MSAVALLCEIVAQRNKVASAFYRDAPDFPALLYHGFLKEAGVMASVVCNDCATAHAAPVVFEAGRYGHYCPDVGFVPLAREDIRAVQPNLPLLIEGLAEALDCRKRKASALHGQTWRIGADENGVGEVMLYFHPHLQNEEDAWHLTHALGREVRSDWRLVVTAAGILPISGAKVVPLDDLAELDLETGTMRILAQPGDLAGVPRKNTGGRPSKHGGALAGIIADRIKSGSLHEGVNAESRAVLAEFEARHPGRPTPSLATIKRHVRKSRGGS